MNMRIVLYSLSLAVAATVAVAAGPAISSPASRQGTLRTVEQLLAEKAKPAESADAIRDPFNPSAQDLQEDYDPNAAAKPAARKSAADVLQEIAKQIQPTGSVTLGGEPYLLFGERRRKMGDKVTVFLDGVEYEAEIGTIEHNRFQIHYNDLQTTRSIK